MRGIPPGEQGRSPSSLPSYFLDAGIKLECKMPSYQCPGLQSWFCYMTLDKSRRFLGQFPPLYRKELNLQGFPALIWGWGGPGGPHARRRLTIGRVFLFPPLSQPPQSLSCPGEGRQPSILPLRALEKAPKRPGNRRLGVAADGALNNE